MARTRTGPVRASGLADDGLVLAQMLCVAGIVWPGGRRWRLPRALGPLAWVAVATGGTFALAAAAQHGTHLTPRVAPPADAELLTGGAYAVSRHPVYTGLLVAGLGVAVLRRRAGPLVAWTALVAVLDRKTWREEAALSQRFGEAYEDYRRRTPRL